MSEIITLERAKKHLIAWLDAEIAVSTGQMYRIGPKQLQRADLSEIRKQIAYWRGEVNRLGGKQSRKAMRIIPRDL